MIVFGVLGVILVMGGIVVSFVSFIIAVLDNEPGLLLVTLCGAALCFLGLVNIASYNHSVDAKMPPTVVNTQVTPGNGTTACTVSLSNGTMLYNEQLAVCQTVRPGAIYQHGTFTNQ